MSITCGQALVALLEQYEVDTVFGIPGVHNLELYRGLESSSIKHHTARHEGGLGFMADGYARSTGKPGVAFVITGPGVTNISTAIGQSFSDSIPLLVISSVNESWSLGKRQGRLHECDDQLKITQSITAFNYRVTDPSELEYVIARAFEVFSSARPRPVHIEIPLDVLALECSPLIAKPVSYIPPSLNLDAAVQKLNQAKAPMLILGGGSTTGVTDLLALAERCGWVVATTVAAKHLVPATHPHSIGSVLCVEQGWQLMEQADCVLAVGTELADTDFWRDRVELEGKLIRVDIDEYQLQNIYSAELSFCCDAGYFARELSLHDKLRSHLCWIDPTSFKAQLLSQLDPMSLLHQQVVDAITSQLPADTLLYSDMTQLAYSANYLADLQPTNKWFHPTGFGTLGFGLPAAIGGALATGHPTLAICGDSGLQYTLNELASARAQITTPFVVVLWNNRRLGQIKDDMLRLGVPTIGVEPGAPDFELIAKGYGFEFKKPTSLAFIHQSINEAVASNQCTFIEIDSHLLFEH